MGVGGGGGPSSQSGTNLYTWKELLPEWTQAGQQAALPWLMSRAFSGGMTPTEGKQIWQGMKGEVDQAAATARKDVASRWIGGGDAALNSPAYNAMRGAVDIDRMSQVRKAAADFARIKQGSQETATKNMLTGLYTQVPYATSQWQTSSGGGGK